MEWFPNSRNMLMDRIIEMRSNRDMIEINDPDIKNLLKHFSKINKNITQEKLSESIGITIQKGYSMGELNGVIYLSKQRITSTITDTIPVCRVGGFDELRRWAESDKKYDWGIWIICLIGFIIEIVRLYYDKRSKIKPITENFNN